MPYGVQPPVLVLLLLGKEGEVRHHRAMLVFFVPVVFFFSSRRRHTRLQGDLSSDVCSSDLQVFLTAGEAAFRAGIVSAVSGIDHDAGEGPARVAHGAGAASEARGERENEHTEQHTLFHRSEERRAGKASSS